MIVGVAMVKDEADVIGWTLHHLARQGVERFVVADNGSTDATRSVLVGVENVTVVDDPDPRHYQAEKTNRLVHTYCSDGDWVVPFDADELWTGGTVTLAQRLNTTTADVVLGRVFDYLPSAADDPTVTDPYRRTTSRLPQPEPLPVVAFRYHPEAVLEEGNHGVKRPGERGDGLVVRHLQYRSLEQFRRKVRNGKAALEAAPLLHPTTGLHWRRYGAMSDHELTDEWHRMTSQPMVYDPL